MDMESAKEEFLKRFGDDYGYPNGPKSIDEIRATEFKRLEGNVYLDHAGATLYSEIQLENIMKELSYSLLGNPHSQSESSMATSDFINAARAQVLDYFNASPKDYKCIFTSGATASMKLVGEFFPWSSESYFAYTMENHNSVLGIREYALDHGGASVAVDIEGIEKQNGQVKRSDTHIRILKRSVQRRTVSTSARVHQNGLNYNLFAFPSECNFSGIKFPLDLVSIIKDGDGNLLEGSNYRGRWMVLIDAAKGCATQPTDLSRHPADFVVFSFYKIFGYPTGLGALLVRNEAAKLLNKAYFSGGTVSASIADIDFAKRRESVEQFFEDGTSNFLSIVSILHGFKIINTLTVTAIDRHTMSLATYVKDVLGNLKHENGENVCIIYGEHAKKVKSAEFGPTITFNLKREDGSWVGYRELEKLASLSGIQLRTGCFCNPGACAKYLALSHEELLLNIEDGHVCWDDTDILHGKPTGAIRISFGYMSTFEDAEKFLTFIKKNYVRELSFSNTELLSRALPSGLHRGSFFQCAHLKSITIYPIKSCGGFSVQSWPLSPTGLLYDRAWLLRGIDGEILTQKKVPALCHVHTWIDLGQQIMYLESKHCEERLEISLLEEHSCHLKEEIYVYGQRYEVSSYDREVDMWFKEATRHPCTLVRCSSFQYQYGLRKYHRERLCRDMQKKLNFVNEAQFLLVSEDSVKDLRNRLERNNQEDNVDAMRFRPNLIIAGVEPYAEDNWRILQIGKAMFESLGGCSRCQMINLDQRTGQAGKTKEPLATLASYRRVKGRILFGILLRYENPTKQDGDEGEYETDVWLHVGDGVHPSSAP